MNLSLNTLRLSITALRAQIEPLQSEDSMLQSKHARAIRACDSAECSRLLALRKPLQEKLAELNLARVELERENERALSL